MQMRPDGVVVAGHGGPGVFVDGRQIVPPTAGNDPSWIAAGRVLCNDEHSQLSTLDADGSNRVLVDPRGASRVATDPDAPDATFWAAFLQDGKTGIYSSWGLSVPAGELYAMRAGALFGRQNFQSPGGLCAWIVGDPDPSRLLWDEPSAVVVEFSALSAQEVLWTDNARQLRTHGLPAPQQTAPSFGPRVFRVRNALYLLEWRDSLGLVLRPWMDASHGWIVDPGEAFGPCGRVDDARVLLAWSPNIAEQGPVKRGVVDTTSKMSELVPVPEPIPPDPVPPDPEPPQPEPPDPTPPDPEPIPPQPEPPQPGGRVVEISLSSVQAFDSPETVTEVPHPDGQGLVALQTAAGLFKSMAPGGIWDDDKPSAGAWERFLPYGGVYLHYDGDTQTTYSVALISVVIPYSQSTQTQTAHVTHAGPKVRAHKASAAR